MLEHMGVRVLGERQLPHPPGDGDGALVSLHDFKLEAPVSDELEPEALARLFEDTFARVFRGEVENDDFNRLVLRAGLAADDIVVLRAYAKYCKQIGFALSQATIEATLAAQPHIARMLVKLFQLRLHPSEHDDAAAGAAGARHRAGAGPGQQPQRGPRAAPAAGADPGHAAHQPLAHRGRPRRRDRAAAQLPELQARFGPGAGAARARGRCSRSSSTRRASRASTCAAARSRAAGCAGATGRRTSAPRCWAW